MLSLYFKSIYTKSYNEQKVEDVASVWFHTFLLILYVTPLFVAYLADTILGRFKTLMIVSLIDLLGHIILIFAAMTDSTKHPEDIPEK